jgi:hypothetical protein
MTTVLVQGTTPGPREGALIALLYALRSTHKVVDGRDHGLRRKDVDLRAKEIAEGSWASDAVREAVDAMTAAVVVAVTASTVAVASGSG